MDKVSIIIPVYNAEKYLNKCLESVLKQTYKNIEVILIDDGSSDLSFKICNNFKENDSRIKVISKKNGGVSSARNLGILNSDGKYICFIDSDDYIDSNLVEVLYDTLIQNKAEISICNYIKDTNGNLEYISSNIDKLILTGSEVTLDLLIPLIEKDKKENEHNLCGFRGPVAKLFEKEIIKKNNLLFNESLKIGEDFLFNLQYLSYVNTVAISKDFLYYYVTNNNSATWKYKKQCWNDIYKKTILEVKAFLEENNLVYEAGERLNRLILKYFFICIYNELKNNDGNLSRIKNINNMCRDILIKEAVKNSDIREYKNKKRIILHLYKYNFYTLIYFFVAIVK